MLLTQHQHDGKLLLMSCQPEMENTMLTRTMQTYEYPTRYAAQMHQNVLVEYADPNSRLQGGFEFAVYSSNNLFIEIVSYQGTEVLMDVMVCTNGGWNSVYCKRHDSYDECKQLVDDFVYPPLYQSVH